MTILARKEKKEMERLRFYWAVYKGEVFKWTSMSFIGVALVAIRMDSPMVALMAVVVGVLLAVITGKHW